MSMSGSLSPPGLMPNALLDIPMTSTTTTTILPPITSTAAGTSASSSSLAPNHAFVKLCLLWTALHRTNSLPPACKGVLSEDNLVDLQKNANLGDILNRINDDKPAVFHQRPRDLSRDNHMKYHYRYTTRSLSVIG